MSLLFFFISTRYVVCKKWGETMGDEEVSFLPYDKAVSVVAAIQEEEGLHRLNHRILAVYNQADKEICWFDFDEVISAIGHLEKGEEKQAVSEYILNRIPTWALDI